MVMKTLKLDRFGNPLPPHRPHGNHQTHVNQTTEVERVKRKKAAQASKTKKMWTPEKVSETPSPHLVARRNRLLSGKG